MICVLFEFKISLSTALRTKQIKTRIARTKFNFSYFWQHEAFSSQWENIDSCQYNAILFTPTWFWYGYISGNESQRMWNAPLRVWAARRMLKKLDWDPRGEVLQCYKAFEEQIQSICMWLQLERLLCWRGHFSKFFKLEIFKMKTMVFWAHRII